MDFAKRKLEHMNMRRGKVRDIFHFDTSHLLMDATDRISVYNFNLYDQRSGTPVPLHIPYKGAVLNALNIHNKKHVLKDCIDDDDIISFGDELRKSVDADDEALSRMALVRKYEVFPIEAIVRGFITGSAWSHFQKHGDVYGHKVSGELWNGAPLGYPIFTPTDKSATDDPILADKLCADYGPNIERKSIQCYYTLYHFMRERLLVMADTKFEYGKGPDGKLVLIDEAGTLDSSRYWDEAAYLQAMETETLPPHLDKEEARIAAAELGIKGRDPLNKEDVEFVRDVAIPDALVSRLSRLYRYVFWRITGSRLEEFQREEMGLSIAPPGRNVHMIMGSDSDRAQVLDAVTALCNRQKTSNLNVKVHVMSCHRNPLELMNYAAQLEDGAYVIAAAGKAAALPGILQSWLRHYGKNDVRILGVGLDGKSEKERLAARFSISELPDSGIIQDQDERVYFGPDGCLNAVNDVCDREFPEPKTPKAPKPPRLNMSPEEWLEGKKNA